MIRLTRFLPFVLIVIAAAGCRQQPPAREYPLTGQIVGINRASRQLTVKHGDIPGLMPAMIMSFNVADPAEIDRRKAGELITATLVVRDLDSELRNIKVTGTAPVDRAVARNSTTAVLQAGDQVPDTPLLDEDGRERRLSDWRGRAVLLTFIYTRCPLPEFCPRLERNLKDLQARLMTDPGTRGRVSLIAVTFDPRHDTPEVLKKRSADLGADPAIWTYLTGEVETIEDFAARFGVTIMRNPADETDITHNLRTAVIAPDGRLVDTLSGSDWTATDALAALLQTSARTN